MKKTLPFKLDEFHEIVSDEDIDEFTLEAQFFPLAGTEVAAALMGRGGQ